MAFSLPSVDSPLKPQELSPYEQSKVEAERWKTQQLEAQQKQAENAAVVEKNYAASVEAAPPKPATPTELYERSKAQAGEWKAAKQQELVDTPRFSYADLQDNPGMVYGRGSMELKMILAEQERENDKPFDTFSEVLEDPAGAFKAGGGARQEQILEGGVSAGEFQMAAIEDANVRLIVGGLEMMGFAPKGTARQMRVDYEAIKDAFLTETDDQGNQVEAGVAKKTLALGLIGASRVMTMIPSAAAGRLTARILAESSMRVLGKRAVGAGAGAGIGAAETILEAQGFPEGERAGMVAIGIGLGGAAGLGGQYFGEISREVTRRVNRNVHLVLGDEIVHAPSAKRTSVEWLVDTRETIARQLFNDRRGSDRIAKEIFKKAATTDRAIQGRINRGVHPFAISAELRDVAEKRGGKAIYPEEMRRQAKKLLEETEQMNSNSAISQAGIHTEARMITKSGDWEKAEVPIYGPDGSVAGSRPVPSRDAIFNRPEIKDVDGFKQHMDYYLTYRRHLSKVWQNAVEEGKGRPPRYILDSKTTERAQNFMLDINKAYPADNGISILDVVAKDLGDHSHLQLLNLKEAGMLSGSQVDNMMREGQDYVPFHRIADTLEQNAKAGSQALPPTLNTPRALAFGASDAKPIMSPIDEIFMNGVQVNQAVNRQMTRSTLVDIYESSPELFPAGFRMRKDGGGGLAVLQDATVKRLDSENYKAIARLGKRRERLHKELLDDPHVSRAKVIREDIEFVDAEVLQLQENSTKFFHRLSTGDPGAMKVFRPDTKNPGEVVQRMFDAPVELMDAMDALPPNMMPAVGPILHAATKALKVGALSTPAFALRNLFRDQVMAGVYSQNGMIPGISVMATAMKELSRMAGMKDEAWEQLLRDFDSSGVMRTTFVNSTDGPLTRRTLNRGLDLATTTRTGRAVRIANQLSTKGQRVKGSKAILQEWGDSRFNPMVPLEAVANTSERLSRLSEYRLARSSGQRIITKKGLKAVGKRVVFGTKGGLERKTARTLRQAQNDASGVTLNFARGGRFGKSWNRYEPFVNAELQDLAKFTKMLGNKETMLPTVVKALAYVTAPALGLQAMWKSDPEFWNLPEHVRAHYLMLGKDRNGNFLKIPRPPGAVSVIFGHLAETMMAVVHQSTDNRSVSDKFAESMTLQSDPRAVPDYMNRVGQALMDETPLGIPLSAASLAVPGLRSPLHMIPGLRKLGIPADGGDRLLDLLPQGIQVGTEAYFGRDPFRGKDIIPKSLQGASPENQVTPSTSGLAVALSKWAGLGSKYRGSPMKMQYMIDSTFGTLAAAASRSLPDIPMLGIENPLAQDSSVDPGNAATAIRDLPLPFTSPQHTPGLVGEAPEQIKGGARSFLVGDIRRALQTGKQTDQRGDSIFGLRSRYVGELFELRDSAKQAQIDYDLAKEAGNDDEMGRILSYSPELWLKSPIDKLSRDINEAASLRRSIAGSDEFTAEEKFNHLTDLDYQISLESAEMVSAFLREMINLKANYEGEFLSEAPFFEVTKSPLAGKDE